MRRTFYETPKQKSLQKTIMIQELIPFPMPVSLHNKVNERLKKPIFDCKKAMDYWGGDCGCGSKD